MPPWLNTVRSLGAPLSHIVPTSAGRALLLLALIGGAGVAALSLIHPRIEAPLPGGFRVSNRALDMQRERLAGLASMSHVAQPGAPAPASVPDPGADGWSRRIIRRASLDVELPDVEQGVARLAAVVESVGGFISSTDSQLDQRGTARAAITAYVPPGQFSKVLGGLDSVGRVTHREIGGQDVSEEFVDLEARIRNMERHEAQLLSFMGRAQKVADLLGIENELGRVRGEIERATGRLRFLRARTDLATIEVALVRAPLASPPDGVFPRFVQQLKQAFTEGWSTALSLALAAAVLAAQLSPLVIPAGGIWALYRRRAGRHPNE
ncbi:MAG TPA: DUF4349 domain-containing protein [Candidatus Bathyarchaeia archaeon]|nr:DUF4349 domain-containing protein [Candidatus Bathyarchaeia archaeon]